MSDYWGMERYWHLRNHHDEFAEVAKSYLTDMGEKLAKINYQAGTLEHHVRDLSAQLTAFQIKNGPFPLELQTTMRLVMFSLDALVGGPDDDDDEPAWSYTQEQDFPVLGAVRRLYKFDNGYEASVVLGIVPVSGGTSMTVGENFAVSADIWEIAVMHDGEIVKTHLSELDTVFRVHDDDLHDALERVSDLPPRS